MTRPIAADGLTHVYGRTRPVTAVADLSLTVDAGDVFALLGPNGAGKTTALLCLLGLIIPRQGTCRLFGEDPAVVPEVFRQVGYLPEEPQYHELLTPAEELELAARLLAVPDRAARVAEVLEQVGLSGARDRAVRTLSKGMKQRLGFGCAIIHRPRLLFLDEPTRGLDPVGVADLRRLMLELNRAGTTVFLNSHVLAEVAAVCNRVAIMVRGRQVSTGKISDLLTAREEYRVEYHGTVQLPAGVRAADPPAAGGAAAVVAADRLAELLAAIAAQGGSVEKAERCRESLEDYFMRVVQS
ncbi:MAG TPA: ABC transporter ATP-binding protein [bacterium]|nr:ABC transporter ATP-binding protein [bacterium]